MASIEAKILHRIQNDEGRVQALTGSIGGVVFHARGMGSYHDTNDPTLGFPGRWASGLDPTLTIKQNIDYIALRVADSIAHVCEQRGFKDNIDSIRLGSASAPIGIEVKIKEILSSQYQLEVGTISRDSLACNGTVWALTQAAQSTTGSQVIATVEHTSPYTQNTDGKIKELFGDGVAAIAFDASDLTVLGTRTIFEQDTQSVLTLPHTKAGTLAPKRGRKAFKGDSTCTIVGEPEHVFTYKGGTHQPPRHSPQEYIDRATMRGSRLLQYFATRTPEIMKQVFNTYLERDGEESIRKLNRCGVIHQPSKPVLDAVVKILNESTPSAITSVAKKGPIERGIVSRLGETIKHLWTPWLEESTLHHNNVSGATTVFSLLAMIEAGLISEQDIMFTGMGVGNNITSTIFRFTPRHMEKVELSSRQMVL